MINNCDKCGSLIYNGKCACGFWYEKDSKPELAKTFERAILAYDFMTEQYNDDSPFSGDHSSGNCFVFFKGDFQLCEKVKDFIRENSTD